MFLLRDQVGPCREENRSGIIVSSLELYILISIPGPAWSLGKPFTYVHTTRVFLLFNIMKIVLFNNAQKCSLNFRVSYSMPNQLVHFFVLPHGKWQKVYRVWTIQTNTVHTRVKSKYDKIVKFSWHQVTNSSPLYFEVGRWPQGGMEKILAVHRIQKTNNYKILVIIMHFVSLKYIKKHVFFHSHVFGYRCNNVAYPRFL